MKVAILSDIHGNMDALEQVLSDIAAAEVDDVISLGDNIGYGPEPERVVRCLEAKGIRSVQGNHELAVAETRFQEYFNPAARESIEKTAAMLSKTSRKYCADLPKHIVAHGARFVHGFPPSSPLKYLFQVFRENLRQSMEALLEPICFVGHTHELEQVGLSKDGLVRKRLVEGIQPMNPGTTYILNIGSVGQPRDGDNRAKYVVWDRENRLIDVRFIPYDISSAARKIERAGLPKIHAKRLW